MADQRKTKKQLLEELEQERERSPALAEVSKLVAAAHDTDEVLNLIVNESTRLVGATGAYIRLLEADGLVLSVRTESVADFLADVSGYHMTQPVEEGNNGPGHVLATKKPWMSEDVTKEDLTTSENRLLAQKHDIHGVAFVPLVANDVSIGVLAVIDSRIRRFTEDEVSLLTAFADQASLALEKARLLSEAEREKERSDALYRVSSLLAGAHDTDEVLDLIVNEAARLLRAPSCSIRLLEGDVLTPRAGTKDFDSFLEAFNPTIKVEEGTSLAGHVMATKKPLVGEDAMQMLTPEARQWLEEQGRDPSAVATVPLLANDQSIGTLTMVDDAHGRRFTVDEVSLLTAFADQASLALEKARLLNEAEREKERSDSLYRVSNKLAGAHDTNEVLDLIVNEAARLVGASGAWIRLLEGDFLVKGPASASTAKFVSEVAFAQPAGEAAAASRILASKVPQTYPDILLGGKRLPGEVPFHPETLRLLKKYGIRGVVSLPLLANDRPVGVLRVWDKQVRLFTEDEIALLSAFADQASLALEKARLLNEAEREKERSDALYQISNKLAGVHDTDEVLDLIVNEAARLLDAPYILLRLVEEGVLSPKAATEAAAAHAAEVGTHNVEEGTSGAGHAMETREPIHGEGMSSPEALQNLLSYGFYATAVFPLLANGRSIGTLSRDSKLENANLSGANLRDTNLTGVALHNAQLTHLISIEGSDFTGVSGLSDESLQYLLSIAKGSHPATYRQTAQTLNNLAASENS